MFRRRNMIKLSVVAAVVALSVTACSPAEEPSDEPTVAPETPTELTVVRWASSTPVFGPEISTYTSIPVELGFYEEEGIRVEFQNLAGGAAASQAVAAGQADFSTSGNVPFYNAINNGFDLVGVCDSYPSYINSPAVPADSDIRTLKDLEGKTLGAVSLEATSIPLVKAMVENEGGDPNLVEFVATGLGAPAVAALQAGQVDGLALWNGPYASMEAGGIPLRKLESEKFNALRLGTIMIANRDFVEQNQDIITGIGRAFAKASIFAAENPEAALRIHWKQYPESKPTGVSDEEAVAQGLVVMNQAISDAAPPAGQQWCDIPPANAAALQEVLIDAGILQQGIDVEAHIFNELNDEMNDFDESAIRELAANYSID